MYVCVSMRVYSIIEILDCFSGMLLGYLTLPTQQQQQQQQQLLSILWEEVFHVSMLVLFTQWLTVYCQSHSLTSGNVPQGFTRSPQPGQSRPIPKKDMTTIESQLRHHVKEERLKKQQREDLRHADPWENSLRSTAMAESTYSSSDEFYTLDLNSSYTGSRIGAGGGGLEKSTDLDDSFVSTRPGTSDVIHGRIPDSGLESIPFHEGSGLQQLSQSPPSGKIPTPQSRSLSIQRVRSSSTSSTGIRSKYNHTDSHHDTCKYTLTFSGVTIALLEADPAYTYTTPGLPRQSSGPLSSSGSEGSCYGRYSSVDEGGLDPMRYFEGVVEILKSGVNKKVFQSTKEKLEQVLPNDHLL